MFELALHIVINFFFWGGARFEVLPAGQKAFLGIRMISIAVIRSKIFCTIWGKTGRETSSVHLMGYRRQMRIVLNFQNF